MKNANEIATRNLCKNLCNIVGLSSLMTKHFMVLIKECLIHNVAQDALDHIDGKLPQAIIQIPFIGTLDCRFESGQLVSYSFDIDDNFKSDLLKAINEGKSPLLEHAETSMVNQIKKQYNSLI